MGEQFGEENFDQEYKNRKSSGKKGKCNMKDTGSTIRQTNSQNRRSYSLQATVRKQVSSGNSKKDGMTVIDGDMKDGDVLYSLNKKERWILPTSLEAAVNSKSPEDVKLVVTEHHKLGRETDCVAAHVNTSKDARWHHCYPKNGYAKAQDLLIHRQHRTKQECREERWLEVAAKKVEDKIRKDKTAIKRKKRSWRRFFDELPLEDVTLEKEVIQDDLNQETTPEVTYELYYPTPSRKHLVCNPKLLDIQPSSLDEEELNHRNQVGKKSNYRGRKGKSSAILSETHHGSVYDYMPCKGTANNHFINNTLYEYDEIENDYEQELADIIWEDYHDTNPTRFSKRDKKVEFCEVFDKVLSSGECNLSLPLSALNSQRIQKTNPDTNYEDLLKSFVVIDEMAADKADNLRDRKAGNWEYTRPETADMHPVSVFMSSEEIQKYTELYMEGKSYPCRASVRIDTVCNLPSNLKQLKLFLIFENEESSIDDAEDCKLKLFRVSLNGNFLNMSTISLVEVLQEMQKYTFEDILTAVEKMIDCLPKECLPQAPNEDSSSYTGEFGAANDIRMSEYLCGMNDLLDYSMKIQRPNELYDVLPSTSYAKEQIHSDSLDEKKSFLPDSEFCSVCCAELTLSSEGATCLKKCQHWFCNRCWKDYLLECIYRQQLNITCLAYDCDCEVDTVTMLSLVDLRTCTLYRTAVVDAAISRQSEIWKWCPNPKCERAIKLTGKAGANMPVNIVCGCNQIWCFLCKREAHWPVDCQQAQNYHEKLVKLGLMEEKLVLPYINENNYVATVKKCPHCGKIWEKNGGCRYMACSCGKGFCWTCGENFTNYGHMCSIRRSRETVKVVYYKRQQGQGSAAGLPRFLEQCAAHRRARNPVKVQHLLLATEKVVRKMKISNWRKNLNNFDGENESLSFENLVKFFRASVYFAVQLHYMVEHCYIALMNGSKHRDAIIASAKRLEFVAVRIYQIFESDTRRDVKYVVPLLRKLVNSAEVVQRNLLKMLHNINKP